MFYCNPGLPQVDSCSASQANSCVFFNPKFYYAIYTRTRHLILLWTNWNKVALLHSFSLRSVLVLFYHIHPSLKWSLFQLDFQSKILYTFLVSLRALLYTFLVSLRATCDSAIVPHWCFYVDPTVAYQRIEWDWEGQKCVWVLQAVAGHGMTDRSVMRFSGLSLKRRHCNDQPCEVTVA
jgi:hypothetical protein